VNDLSNASDQPHPSKGDFDRFTYTAFPPEKYQRFLDTYVVPYGETFVRCLDLGCGSGGLIDRMQHLYGCRFVGVDVSRASIEACRKRDSLPHDRAAFLHEDLFSGQETRAAGNDFDLVVSYSVLHFVRGATPEKLRRIQELTRPGALIAIDVLARITWNRAMFGLVRGLIRTGVWGIAVRGLAPVIGPSFPKAFIEELGRMTYLRNLRYGDFFDLSYFDSPEFRECFEMLRLDVVPQDSFFTGRKARFTLRRR
jgi:SAM-dependent methyltransferase